jgi:hypothetical protein
MGVRQNAPIKSINAQSRGAALSPIEVQNFLAASSPDCRTQLDMRKPIPFKTPLFEETTRRNWGFLLEAGVCCDAVQDAASG